MKQNESHIKALRALLPTANFKSFVVFTSDECDLRVSAGDDSVVICKLSELISIFSSIVLDAKPAYGMDGIDHVFKTLLPYAPEMEKKVIVDDQEIPFGSYLNTIRENYNKDLNSAIERNEMGFAQKKKNYRTTCLIIALISVLLGGGFGIVSKVNLEKSRADFERQMRWMKSNFEHVEPYNGGNISLASDFITVEKALLSDSKSIENAVDFESSINVNSDEFFVKFTDDSKYIVMLKNGTVKEYDMFEAGSIMNQSSTIAKDLPWNKVVNFGKVTFFNVDSATLTYIKVKGVSLCDSSFHTIKDDFEIELYSKE